MPVRRALGLGAADARITGCTGTLAIVGAKWEERCRLIGDVRDKGRPHCDGRQPIALIQVVLLGDLLGIPWVLFRELLERSGRLRDGDDWLGPLRLSQ